MTTLTFRDQLRTKLSPPWLRTGNNEKYLYSIAIILDTMADALIAGLKSRFPGLYSYESLSLIGKERRIARGVNEADSVYAARLPRWLDDHRRRGGPYALLAQLHAYYAADPFPIDLIYRNGRRFQMDAAGNVVRDVISFSPDANPAQWARWWLFYYEATAPSLPLSTAALSAYKLVPREWNAGHTLGRIIVLAGGAELWNFPVGHVWNESGTWNTASSTEIAIN